MILPAPAVAPPMTLLDDSTSTPSAPLPDWEYRPAVDGPATPIWLPRTWFPSAPGWIQMPCWPLPVRTFPSCGAVPPIVALVEPSTIPCAALPVPVKISFVGEGSGDP